MKDAVIVTAVRSPVGKAHKGSLRHTRPEDLGAIVMQEAIDRTPGLEVGEIDDVILGCAMPEGEQGANVARITVLRAGLPTHIPGMTINRFCSSGLQSIALSAAQIQTGMNRVILAGGLESMSTVPMMGYKAAPNPWLMEHYPETYMAMGHTAEEVGRRFGVSREDQDAFAVSSHQKAAAAILAGKFQQEIVPIPVRLTTIADGRPHYSDLIFREDEGVRPDTTSEVLAKLRPAFHAKGSVTAGNASQTSDGAAAVVMMSGEHAAGLGLQPLAIFRSFAVCGVDPEIMGVGPVLAIPKALELAGLSLADIDLFEINEAFAVQCLQIIRQLEIDPAKVNVNGGAIALGHPLGCTGAKLTATLLHELKRSGGKYGVVSMCVGGGMGAAGVFEVL